MTFFLCSWQFAWEHELFFDRPIQQQNISAAQHINIFIVGFRKRLIDWYDRVYQWSEMKNSFYVPR